MFLILIVFVPSLIVMLIVFWLVNFLARTLFEFVYKLAGKDAALFASNPLSIFPSAIALIPAFGAFFQTAAFIVRVFLFD